LKSLCRSTGIDDSLTYECGTHGSILGFKELPQGYRSLRVLRKNVSQTIGSLGKHLRDVSRVSFRQMSKLEEPKDLSC
jgi:hypothetical protein